MNKHRHNGRKAALLAWLILWTGASSSQDLAPFHAVYRISVSGLSGEAQIDLRAADTPGEYLYRTRMSATGLARLIRNTVAEEESRFRVENGQLVPETYRFHDGSERERNTTDMEFDWETMWASGQHEGQYAVIPLEPGVMDRLTADLAVILQLQSGADPTSQLLADSNRLKVYQYTAMGEETIQVRAGRFQTLKYLRQRPGSSRRTFIWYAPALDYLPVRAEHQRRQQTRASMELTELPGSNQALGSVTPR